MNPNKALWEKGDFTRIAETMRESGEALVNELGITPGMKVLDLGCGDGTTAMPAARRGADVLGVDIASNLVAAGNERAEAEGLTNIRFQEGDATDLSDLADDSFDLVVSIFGAMFAPKPFEVAKEMVRVTRPGGTDRDGQLDPQRPDACRTDSEDQRRLRAAPAGGVHQPGDVGSRGQDVRARFGEAGVGEEQISFSRRDLSVHLQGIPGALVTAFRNYYGPTMNAFEAAEQTGRADELQDELERLLHRQNTSPDGNTTSIPATYLRVAVAA